MAQLRIENDAEGERSIQWNSVFNEDLFNSLNGSCRPEFDNYILQTFPDQRQLNMGLLDALNQLVNNDEYSSYRAATLHNDALIAFKKSFYRAQRDEYGRGSMLLHRLIVSGPVRVWFADYSFDNPEISMSRTLKMFWWRAICAYRRPIQEAALFPLSECVNALIQEAITNQLNGVEISAYDLDFFVRRKFKTLSELAEALVKQLTLNEGRGVVIPEEVMLFFEETFQEQIIDEEEMEICMNEGRLCDSEVVLRRNLFWDAIVLRARDIAIKARNCTYQAVNEEIRKWMGQDVQYIVRMVKDIKHLIFKTILRNNRSMEDVVSLAGDDRSEENLKHLTRGNQRMRDVISLAGTCKYFYEALSDNDLWRGLYVKTYKEYPVLAPSWVNIYFFDAFCFIWLRQNTNTQRTRFDKFVKEKRRIEKMPAGFPHHINCIEPTVS